MPMVFFGSYRNGSRLVFLRPCEVCASSENLAPLLSRIRVTEPVDTIDSNHESRIFGTSRRGSSSSPQWSGGSITTNAASTSLKTKQQKASLLFHLSHPSRDLRVGSFEWKIVPASNFCRAIRTKSQNTRTRLFQRLAICSRFESMRRNWLISLLCWRRTKDWFFVCAYVYIFTAGTRSLRVSRRRWVSRFSSTRF